MAKPFFTVVIPTFNRSSLLAEAIESVLNQTFDDFEIIVVDDHSTDDTKTLVRAMDDDRIRYVLNSRCKGGAGARNAGIWKANGVWVAFLDDDDLWLPNKLERLHERISEVDDSVGLLYSGSATLRFGNSQPISLFVPEKEGWIQQDLLYENCIGTFSRVAIRSDLLRTSGGLDERFQALQDAELYVRISALCKAAFLSDILVHKRNSNTRSITLDLEKRLRNSLLFWDKYKHLINKSQRLKHRAASRVFVLALKQRNIKYVVKALVWTLAGILVDPANVLWLVRAIYYYEAQYTHHVS